MKLGKKLLGIVSTAAILTTSLTLPGFFAGAAGKTEADFNNLVLSNDFETDGKGFTGLSDSFRVANENTYFVSTGKNDSLTLDLAAQKNYYLTFKLKFDFGGNQGYAPAAPAYSAPAPMSAPAPAPAPMPAAPVIDASSSVYDDDIPF